MRLTRPSSLDAFFTPLAVWNVVDFVFIYLLWTGHARIRCYLLGCHVFSLAIRYLLLLAIGFTISRFPKEISVLVFAHLIHT